MTPSTESRHRAAGGRGACTHRSRRHCSARAAILLEVILAMALLLFGMAAVGYQINSGLKVAHSNDLHTRSLLLVDSKMAELDAGVLRPSWTGDELKGHFGIIYPGFTWQIKIKPAELPNLYLVTMEIGYNEARGQEQIQTPEMDIEIDDPGTQVIRTVYRLVPKPADVNFQRDFGFSNDEMNELINAASETDPNAAADARAGAAASAGSGAGTGGGGTGGGNAAGGGATGGGGRGGSDPMMAMLQKLIQAVVSGGLDPNSINPRDLAQYLDDETLTQLGPLIDIYFGNGMNAGQLPGALQNPAMQQLLTGRRGGRAGRNRGGRNGQNQVDGTNNPNNNDNADGNTGGRGGRRGRNRDGNNADQDNGANDNNNGGRNNRDGDNGNNTNNGGNNANNNNGGSNDRNGANGNNRGNGNNNQDRNGSSGNGNNGGRGNNRNNGNNRGNTNNTNTNGSSKQPPR